MKEESNVHILHKGTFQFYLATKSYVIKPPS